MTKKKQSAKNLQDDFPAAQEELVKFLMNEARDANNLTKEQRQRLGALLELNKSARAQTAAFIKRGCQFGTVNEAWDALRGLADALKNNRSPTLEQTGWLVSAVERCKEDDEAQLLRELGLVVMGRRRTVSPDVVSARVIELVKSGGSIMASCEQAAEEIGCTPKTAHRWYRAAVLEAEKRSGK